MNMKIKARQLLFTGVSLLTLLAQVVLPSTAFADHTPNPTQARSPLSEACSPSWGAPAIGTLVVRQHI